MYGRGVAVSKSDFATYAFALRALLAAAAAGRALDGTIELHFTYDEEAGGAIGPAWLLAHGTEQARLRDLARDSPTAITTAHNGCLHLEVEVLGKSGHAAEPAKRRRRARGGERHPRRPVRVAQDVRGDDVAASSGIAHRRRWSSG